MSEILFSMIFGHFLADFLLQTNKMNMDKKDKRIIIRFKGLFWHIFMHFIVYLTLLGAINHFSQIVTLTYKEVLSSVLTILLFHLFIDVGKIEISNISIIKSSTWGSTLTFVIDQFLHIISIIFTLIIFDLISYDWQDIFKFLDDFFFKDTINLSSIDKFAIIGFLIIFVTYFCGYLLDIILKKIRPTNSFIDFKVDSTASKKYNNGKLISSEFKIDDLATQTVFNESSIQIGRYIGMLERLLIMFLVASHSITGITFLIAIKALTRFKQFEDKTFAEYYLIGSLLSLLIGIITGYLTIQVIK